jgi:hypothetical protein
MISANIKFNDKISTVIEGMKRAAAAYPRQAEAKFKSLTPIDTGNARRKTKLVGNTTIEANYAYAQPLDNGHSKQAPQGMTKPFEQWVKQRAQMIFGNK